MAGDIDIEVGESKACCVVRRRQFSRVVAPLPQQKKTKQKKESASCLPLPPHLPQTRWRRVSSEFAPMHGKAATGTAKSSAYQTARKIRQLEVVDETT